MNTMIIKTVYLAFLFHSLLTLSSISDRMIFMEDSVLFFWISIPILAFYWILPILLFVGHFYFLREGLESTIPTEKLRGEFLHRALNHFLNYILPLILFLFLQVQASKYQSIFLSSYHFLFIAIDLYLVILFLPQAIRAKVIYVMSIFIVSSLYNYFLLFAILGTSYEREGGLVEAFDKSLTVLNPVFHCQSEEYSFLFPSLNLSNQNLTNQEKSFYKRSFKYANLNGASLDQHLLNQASLQNASFIGSKWK